MIQLLYAASAATALPSRWEFIWASYGVTFIVFIILIAIPVIWRVKLVQQLTSYYQRKDLLKGDLLKSEPSENELSEKHLANQAELTDTTE